MARVTVEDCITKIPNRFELVMKAAQRARNISAGSVLTLERDDDKNPVVALREIADDTVELPELEEQLVKGLQRFVESDEPAEDEMDMAAMQDEIAAESGEATTEEEVREDVLTIETEAQEFSLSIGEDSGEAAPSEPAMDVAPEVAGEGTMEAAEEAPAAPAAPAPDDSAFAGASFEDIAPEDEGGEEPTA